MIALVGFFAALVGDRELVAHVDALDHEHVILGLDPRRPHRLVALRIDFDLTRLQRAGERAGQSAGGGGDYVIQRRRLRRVPFAETP